MQRRLATPRLVWAALAVLVSAAVFSGLGNAAESPLRLQVALPKAQYQQWEDIPVVILLTNVSQVGGQVRLPRVFRSVALQVFDAGTGKPIEARLKRRSAKRGLYLRLQSTGTDKPRFRGLVNTGATKGGNLRVKPSQQRRSAPLQAAVVTIQPGETLQADYELVWEYYGILPPARYSLRAVYATEGLTVASPLVPFEIVPLSPQERETYEVYRRVMLGPSPVHIISAARELLRRYPTSIFARRARYDMVLQAIHSKDWETVVSEGAKASREQVWQGRYEVATMYYARGLWHVGREAEAEELLTSIDRCEARYYLRRLREGKD